jgi:ribonucleoside-diphosphate reductase alpha chain
MIYGYAGIQKYTDQGISADTYADRSQDINLSAKKVIMNPAIANSVGLKSRYYTNSKTDRAETASAAGCASGACTL